MDRVFWAWSYDSNGPRYRFSLVLLPSAAAARVYSSARFTKTLDVVVVDMPLCRTESMVNGLMVYAVNTGLLTR